MRVWQTNRWIGAILAAGLAALFVLGGPLGGAAFAGRTPVTLVLDWSPNTNHTGLYVALEKGWYAEEGIDLQILDPGTAGGAEPVVGSGKAHFGISFQEWVTHARLSGVPIVSIAAIIQHNTTGFASVKQRGISHPRDYEGRTYGGWGFPMERAVLQELMRADGADVEQVQFVTVGQADILSLLQRDVDFMWIFYAWDGIQARLRGIDLNVVMLRDYPEAIPDYYSPVIITSERLIEEDPDLIRRFMRATTRGYEHAIDHPREAAEILVKRVPEMDRELAVASQTWLSPRYRETAPRWGIQRAEVWQRFADWMYERGLVDTRLDASRAFTNQFLP